MTRIGHDKNRPMIRIGFYGRANAIAQWEESLAGRLPPFEIVELISDAGVSCDVALVWAPPRDAFTRCPNLRGIIIRGQGVDHMMRDDTVPRDIPLVGMSLWAARRIVVSQQDFAFPRYTDSSGCNANSASAAINRWLQPRVPDGCVVHSFRHSHQDRLRRFECPLDIADAIGGWATAGVPQKYGSGCGLEVKARWMERIVVC